MKKLLALSALAAALSLNLSCEKQSWEETKMFNQNRTVGGGHGHGEDHAESKDHAPAAAHAPEKP